MGKKSRHEALSALLDGEAGDLERRRLVKEFDADDAETWSRWHLASDLLHGHDSVPVPGDFAAGVVGAVRRRDQRSGWLAGAVRVVVAASVAAATVVGWQFWSAASSGTTGPAVASRAETAAPVTASPARPALVGVGSGSRQPERNGRSRAGGRYAKRLMMRHSELSARYARQGITPAARMASLEARNGR